MSSRYSSIGLTFFIFDIDVRNLIFFFFLFFISGFAGFTFLSFKT